jgi:ABC-type Fe3+ transport system substrate-binding protein
MKPMAETASKTRLYAAVLIILVVAGGIGVWWVLVPKVPPGEGDGAGAITLKIITRHDSTLQTRMSAAFLASSLADQYNITNILWTEPAAYFWPTVIPTYKPDIAWGGGPTLFDQLHQLGLLKKLNSTHMLSVLDRINDTIAGAAMKRFDAQDDAIWVAAAISSFGFTINKPWLSGRGLPYPTTWENLSGPVYGKLLPLTTICMGNAPGTTSNTRIYEIILQKFGWQKGWEIMTRMAGNAEIRAGSVEVQSAVENGEAGVSMSIDFYGYTSQLRNPDCEYRVPLNGSIINGDPIALCTTTTHQAAAEAFIDWVLSGEGQKWWLLEAINRMPVLEDAFLADRANPVNPGGPRDDLYVLYNTTLQNLSIDFNDTTVLSYEYSLIYYFEAVLTNAQTALQSCWHKLVNAWETAAVNDAEFAVFAAMMANVSWGSSQFFTEAYAVSINTQITIDSGFRATMQSTWTTAAEDHYAAVEGLIPP